LADRREGHRHYFSAKAINPLLENLRASGVAPAMASTTRRTASEFLIDRYSSYLLERRGLSRSSVRNYANVARGFLADRIQKRSALLSALRSAHSARVSSGPTRWIKVVSGKKYRWTGAGGTVA
jgi:hypothetical protein